MTPADYRRWIGTTEECADTARPEAVVMLAALLDHDTSLWPAGEVPPLGHWLYFLPVTRQSGLDADGHPLRGEFLPPIALPKRMWASGRVSFFNPVRLGAQIRRRSTIKAIQDKSGRSGKLTFVTVQNEVMSGSEVLLHEEQDIVYREAQSSTGKQEYLPASADPAQDVSFQSEHSFDAIQLFRFSALTFNSHRIHYDADYAVGTEGYPGLVVQGPYLATLLINHFMKAWPGTTIREFRFRAIAPTFNGETLRIVLSGTNGQFDVLAKGDDGQLRMSARVTV